VNPHDEAVGVVVALHLLAALVALTAGLVVACLLRSVHREDSGREPE
jgi:hypothetical protein